MLAVAVASATADDSASPLEGVWSFNGGQVGIQQTSNGHFDGTVLAATKFDQCVHPVGEKMWTDIAPQADGSFWGEHHWFSADGTCTPVPIPGKTAWRILTSASGETYLRVCLSTPESKVQPMIAADGTAVDANYGCFDSALVSALPQGSVEQYVKPRALRHKGCLAGRRLRIRIDNWAADPIAQVSVGLKSHRIKRRARIVTKGEKVFAVLDIRGLPAGVFRVKLKLSTVLGNKITAKKTYRKCPKRKKKKRAHAHSHGA